MAEDIWFAGPSDTMNESEVANIVNECKRQEESCLYTSTSLHEWLKSLRRWKAAFVVVPIILGGIAASPLISEEPILKWIAGICALLAGLTPAVYKALDFDINLEVIADHAYRYKSLQDRFRQAWRIAALGSQNKLIEDFNTLMLKLDEARSSSLTPPERFFKSAQKKIEASDYQFNVDE